MKIPRIRLVLIVSLLLIAGFIILALNIHPVLTIVIFPLVALGSLFVLSNPHQSESDWLREVDDEPAGTVDSTVFLIGCARTSLKVCVNTLNQTWLGDPRTVAALYQLPAGVTIEVLTADQDLTTISPLLMTLIEDRHVSVTRRTDGRQPAGQQFIVADDEHVLLEIGRQTETSPSLTATHFLTRKLGQWYGNRFDRLKAAA